MVGGQENSVLDLIIPCSQCSFDSRDQGSLSNSIDQPPSFFKASRVEDILSVQTIVVILCYSGRCSVFSKGTHPQCI